MSQNAWKKVDLFYTTKTKQNKFNVKYRSWFRVPIVIAKSGH